MLNRWSEEDAARFVRECAERAEPPHASVRGAEIDAGSGADAASRGGTSLALRTYSSRLLGAEDALVLHGGGNTSVKSPHVNVLGDEVSAIFVKASGYDMSDIAPEGHTGLDLQYLVKLRRLAVLSDRAMVNEFRTHMFDYKSATPSLETLMHAFIDRKFIDHTHPDAILALTNITGAEKILRAALGPDIIILEYIKPGFRLAAEAAAAYDAKPGARAMILMHHGLVAWGDTARASYEQTIEIVSAAEAYIERTARKPLTALTAAKLTAPAIVRQSAVEFDPESATKITVDISPDSALETAWKRYARIAPVLRGLLTPPSGDPDRPHRNVVLRPVINSEMLDFLQSERGRALALTPPLTTDFLIRTKALPLWIDDPDFADPDAFKERTAASVSAYSARYNEYFDANAPRLTEQIQRFDALPRVVLIPGLGAVCAGNDAEAAKIAADITAHTLSVKAAIGAMGDYAGLDEPHLFDMEYRSYQHAKLTDSDSSNRSDSSDGFNAAGEADGSYLRGRVAVVTGAAGSIGTGICRGLLQAGCHVALTDLPGEPLEKFFRDLKTRFGQKVIAAPMDVTDPASVAAAFARIVRTWGGVDILIANAGIAMVCSLVNQRGQTPSSKSSSARP